MTRAMVGGRTKRKAGGVIFDSKASWIWAAKTSRRYNSFVCFRREFNVKGGAKSAALNITADSRYEVFVNGKWIGHGPVRAFPKLWPVDTYDLRHVLKAGKNVIAVLVQHFGISTFQYLAADEGLIGQLDYIDGGGARRVVTDSSWRALEHRGYAWPVPRVSVQQGWEEQVDARVGPGIPEEWTAAGFDDRKWGKAVRMEDARAARPGHAGYAQHEDFERREIPYFTREAIDPVAVRNIEAVRPAPYQFNLNPREFLNRTDLSANHLRGRMLLVTWIDSPRAQQIQVHPPHIRPTIEWKLNGELLKFDDHSPQQTDTGVAHAQLRAGKNVLMCALPEAEHLWWAIVNIWTEKAVGFSSSPKGRGSKIPFLAFGPFKSEKKHVFDEIVVDAENPDPSATMEKYLAAWKRGDLSDAFLKEPFARMMTRDMVVTNDVYAMSASDRVLAEVAPKIQEPAALLHDNDTWTTVYPLPTSPIAAHRKAAENDGIRLLLDFGREIIGYHEFEVDAPAGTVIDFHNFEFIQRDGRFNLCEGMNNSFRYVCRGGVQRYRSFVRRGFRYSWMTIRNLKRAMRIRFVRVIQSTYPNAGGGEFACSDSKLNEIWNVGVRSVRCCSEDTYTDCPTYEQTFWVGDARNEAMVDLIANADPRLSAHCLRLAGRSLDRSPIVESQVPSGWQNLLPTWSFLWMRWAQEHFQLTGDREFARKILEFVDRNVAGIESHLNDRGLFQMYAWNLFDWAGMDTPAGGIVTHLQCLASLGLRQCADLAAHLGQDARASHWISLADRLSAATNANLWSNERQAYVDCIRADGTLSPKFSQQTQTAAYISGVATGDRARRCSEVMHNPPAGFVTTGSPFFMFFFLEALVREKKFDALIETIGNYWGQQIDAGATTFWEMFHPGAARLTRSHCHGWSAAPTVFLTQYVAGVRPLTPGYNDVLIAPNPGKLSFAQARVPTPHGIVEVHWSNDDGVFRLRATSPRPMRIELPGDGDVAVEHGEATVQSPRLILAAGPHVRLIQTKTST